MKQNSGLENTHKFYEYTAEEVQNNQVKKLHIYKKIYTTPNRNGMVVDYQEGTGHWTNP